MRNYEQGRRGADAGRLAKVSGALLVRRFSVREPEMFRVVEKVSAENLTSIDKAALVELAQAVLDLELTGLEGDLVQVGGGRGAAIVMENAKRRGRDLIEHDPSAGETLLSDQPLALAHLDFGEHDAMRTLLERLVPRLVPGGQLIIDDYKTSEGCKRAVDDYFRGKRGFQLVRKSRLHVIRN
jgi:hypothetical protein